MKEERGRCGETTEFDTILHLLAETETIDPLVRDLANRMRIIGNRTAIHKFVRKTRDEELMTKVVERVRAEPGVKLVVIIIGWLHYDYICELIKRSDILQVHSDSPAKPAFSEIRIENTGGGAGASAAGASAAGASVTGGGAGASVTGGGAGASVTGGGAGASVTGGGAGASAAGANPPGGGGSASAAGASVTGGGGSASAAGANPPPDASGNLAARIASGEHGGVRIRPTRILNEHPYYKCLLLLLLLLYLYRLFVCAEYL